MGISAVIITMNEERNIERCLQSLSFADEIIVLDSFSSDRTLEIARSYTPGVFQREFRGFSEQKSAALERATQEWVLFVDADEIVTGELAGEITSVISGAEFDGYAIPRLTEFLGKQIRYCGWYPDYQLRLARRTKAHFPNRLVHEVLVVDGSCGRLNSPMLHYSYTSLDHYIRKSVLYARAAAEQRALEGARFGMLDLLLRPGLVFLKKYVLKRGYKDGVHGLVICALTACSCVLRYAMLWELGVRGGSSKERYNGQENS